MLRFGHTRNSAMIASAVALTCLAINPHEASADAPAKPPATQPTVERPGLGEIEVADYCSVLLAPKLRTHLGANDAQRETLEDLNTQLHTRLDACTDSHMPGLNPAMITSSVISARMRLQMAEFGRKVRDALTPEQDRRLVDLFSQGTLTHIDVSVSVNTDVPRFGPNAGKVYRSTSYALNYTHFGEADDKGNAAGTAPGALPKAANAPVAPGAAAVPAARMPADGAAAPAERAPRPRSKLARLQAKSDEPLPPPANIAPADQFAAGRVIHVPTRNVVRQMAVSADGKMLVTIEDQIVRIWDCTSGVPADIEEMDSRSMHLGNVRAVALSPDGKMLALGGDDKSVRLFAINNGEMSRLDTQVSHDSGLWTVAFSPDGKFLFSGADDLNVILWNISGGKLEEKSRIKLQSVFGIKYLAVQPNLLVTCTSGSGDVGSIDFAPAEPILKDSYKISPSPFALPMAMSPADKTLLFGGGHIVHLKGVSERSFATSTRDIKCVAWSPDGKYFATGTDDGHMLVWDTAGKIHYDFQRPTRFNEVKFLSPPSGSKDLLIAAANEDCEIYLLHLKPDAPAAVKAK